MDRNDLINFEQEVITGFKKGKTYGPVHLSGGNEDELLWIFQQVKPEDWVFTTHRSHYHALLKSKDPKWLMKEILSGYSSHINSYKYKIFSSAIVGGIIPIALGTALGNKLKGIKSKVWCFVGDMASEMGQFKEAVKFAELNGLSIIFVIEDNSMGCDTPTKEVWGEPTNWENGYVVRYQYTRTHGHYGVGCLVELKNKKTTTGGMYG